MYGLNHRFIIWSGSLVDQIIKPNQLPNSVGQASFNRKLVQMLIPKLTKYVSCNAYYLDNQIKLLDWLGH